MRFKDEESFDKYPAFKETVLKRVMGERTSTIRLESAKKIKDYMADKATKDEKTFFGGLVPMVIKDARGGG